MRAMWRRDGRELERQRGEAQRERKVSELDDLDESVERDFVRAINKTIDSMASNLDRYNAILVRLDRKLGEALQ